MQGYIIMNTPNFQLTSYGNGWAYCLEQKRTKNSVFFQDADALTFSEQLEQIEAALPNAPSDKILSDLFNIYTGE